VEAVGAEVVAEVVVAEAAVAVEVAEAAGNQPGTTHPLLKGGKSHGALFK
jgi:hypothetical protein